MWIKSTVFLITLFSVSLLFVFAFFPSVTEPFFFLVNEERRKLQFCSVSGCWPATQSTQPMYKYLRQREASNAKKFSQKPKTVIQTNGKRHLGFKPQTLELSGGSTSLDKSLRKQVHQFYVFKISHSISSYN